MDHLQSIVTSHLKHEVLIINTVIWKSGIKAVSKDQCAACCYEGLEVLHFWSMHSVHSQVCCPGGSSHLPSGQSFSADLCCTLAQDAPECCFRWGCGYYTVRKGLFPNTNSNKSYSVVLQCLVRNSEGDVASINPSNILYYL